MSGSIRKAGTLQGIFLILPITLTVMGAVLLAPIMPLLFKQFGSMDGANYLVPMLISLPALCIAFGAPAAGWLADRVGRRKLLIVAMFVYTLCGLLPLVISEYWPLFISRLGVGICEAVVITTSTTLIGDYFSGDQRDKWLGSQAAMASLTAMFLFPVAGFLGAEYGWQGPFAIYGVAFFMMLGVIFFTWEVTQEEGMAVDAESQVETTEALPWKHLGKVSFFTLLGGIMFYLVQFQMGTSLAEFKVDDPSKIGLMLAIASIGVPAGAISFRYIHHKLGIHKLVPLEFAIIGAGFILMANAGSAEQFIAAGFLNQFGAGMLLPTMLTWAVAPLSYANRGRGSGIWQSVFAFGQFASTLSFSFVMAQTSNQLGSIQVFGLISLAVLIVALVFNRSIRTS
jgi:MFS family permease